MQITDNFKLLVIFEMAFKSKWLTFLPVSFIFIFYANVHIPYLGLHNAHRLMRTPLGLENLQKHYVYYLSYIGVYRTCFDKTHLFVSNENITPFFLVKVDTCYC